ncbi:MAG: hypothetical protein ACREN8_04800, partial [Candidatus Dormibacteraceae bacterium]
IPFLPQLPIETIRAAAPGLKERLPRLDKAAELLAYLTEPPPRPPHSPPQPEMLTAVAAKLQATEWNETAIEAALEELREEHGWARGKLFNPIRLAVAGRISPPLHVTLALLPKTEALARLQKALEVR